MVTTKQPPPLPLLEVGQFWLNNRNQETYAIERLPEWSDSPNPEDLEQWVLLCNIRTGADYTRSVESFFGINRDGHPRFTQLAAKPTIKRS